MGSLLFQKVKEKLILEPYYKLIIMKTKSWIIITIISIIVVSCSEKPTIEELKKFAATETYPSDTYLDTVSNKKALIIVAHDDDDAAVMSGTVAKLTAKGWKIKQLCFVPNKSDDNSIGYPATVICEGNELILEDGDYRFGLDTNKHPYMPIPKGRMQKEYKTQRITNAIIKKVNDFQPSVIFTLDNEIGGYGHPDHVFISQLIYDLFINNKINANRIYQGVYTDHMENEIFDKWTSARLKKWNTPNPYKTGKKVYQVAGMPEPNVQVNISNYAKIKMAYFMAYPEEARKNMRKFIPYFQEFDGETYFSIFDREFFRIIKK